MSVAVSQTRPAQSTQPGQPSQPSQSRQPTRPPVPAPLIEDEDGPHWASRARCRPEALADPAPLAGEGGQAGLEYAKQLCTTECPVRTECLQSGLELDRRLGYQDMIYGGLTMSERMALHSPRRRIGGRYR